MKLALLVFCAIAASDATGTLETPPSRASEAPPDVPAPEAPPQKITAVPRKDFGAALWQGTAFNVIPLFWNRLVLQKEMGMVSWETWKENLSRGFAYDPDKFVTNMLSHPQHGALYYGAARANGFNFYESSLFTAFGSLTWEYFGEKSRPSTNDLIVTTLGGISAGETSFRLSDLILDDTATGAVRVWREIFGLAVSPGRAIQRILSGDAWRVGPNPEGTKPGSLRAEVLGGGLYVVSDRPGTPVATEGRGTLGADVRYGDPFEKDLGKPLSTFRLLSEFTTTKDFVSRVQTEGNLAGWRLDDGTGDRTVLAAVFGFNYVNVDLSYGSQTLGFEVSSRMAAGGGWDVVPRLQLFTAYTAIQTSEESVPSTYRNYDWGLGAGVSAGVRVRHEGRDITRVDYTDVWSTTVNGPTRWNEVQYGQAAAFLPVARAWTVGAEYTFHQHRNVSPAGRQRRISQQIRALVSWTAFDGRP